MRFSKAPKLFGPIFGTMTHTVPFKQRSVSKRVTLLEVKYFLSYGYVKITALYPQLSWSAGGRINPNIERKSYIKYLGVFIDEHLRWGPQIQHISNRVAKNIGIINKLRYHLNLKVMKQLYHTLIFPYLNYGILSWGNTYKTVD